MPKQPGETQLEYKVQQAEMRKFSNALEIIKEFATIRERRQHLPGYLKDAIKAHFRHPDVDITREQLESLKLVLSEIEKLAEETVSKREINPRIPSEYI